MYDAETWTLRKVDQKYLESFEMCCWKRTQKMSRPIVREIKKMLQSVKEDRNILQTIKRRWIIGLLTSSGELPSITRY